MSSKTSKYPRTTPVIGEKNVLITAALPYVNNVPHLGNIIGSVLSADVYARYCRQRGYNVIYISGTDEYGTATEFTARLNGVSPKDMCDKYHVIHKECYEWFDISFDYFGRTTTDTHTRITQDIYSKIKENGFIEKVETERICCNECNTFLADRYMSGECPYCKYDDCNGDQCDNCGKLINDNLINPYCVLCKKQKGINTKLSKNKTSHMYFRLSDSNIVDRIDNFVYDNSIIWSKNSVNITNELLNKKLENRCITRDLTWGVKVPNENKVFYVWFDAPIGYISITQNYYASKEDKEDNWTDWWKPDKTEIDLIQFMGKDNVIFHSVLFPAMLMATKDKYTLPLKLESTEYLMYEGNKFSKRNGIGIFADTVKNYGIPSESWRFYMLYNRPEKSDSNFEWSDFCEKNNTIFSANVGNLVNRVLKFIDKNLDGKIPTDFSLEISDIEKQLEKTVNNYFACYLQFMENQQIKDALKAALAISSTGNKYICDKSPFSKKGKELNMSILILANLIMLIAIIFEPFTPGFSDKVLEQLNIASLPEYALANIKWNLFNYHLSPGHTIKRNISPIIGFLSKKEDKVEFVMKK